MTSQTPPVPERFAGVLDWVPAYGHALRRVGRSFDVVRIDGDYGGAVAARLFAADRAPGPVVVDRSRRHAVYFFVAPGAGAGYRWPSGTSYLGRRAGEVYVGVPALEGETWPLSWRCPPRPERPFVDAAVLHAAL
ncbi:hypothetical protein [Yinghuangia seranimata]|uniref:hypothetical protein n=1 Tax=Yinghuangia seranimata TaxID=408067 RepID=UPI00248B0764|nr:hypothetical protein [Yinghuangia seranimata]MDI2130723.1 hypothetical protein [Yinghuangia seranimata]